MDQFRPFVENQRFERSQMTFITAHIVGSNNNFEIRDAEAVNEFFERDRANVAWLKASFDQAIKHDAVAVVLAIHADMFEFGFWKWWRAR